MKGNTGNSDVQRTSRWRIAAWSAAALILLLPLVAMQFTDEVNWTEGDFVFAAVLLFGSLGAYELAVRKTRNTTYRAAAGVALAATFLLVWINGAVGIIGSEANSANLMYYGVLAVGIAGAFIARFQPEEMAHAMIATALAQALVAVIALATRLGTTGPIWPWDLLGATGMFVALWGGSAWLFQKAARQHPQAQRP